MFNVREMTQLPPAIAEPPEKMSSPPTSLRVPPQNEAGRLLDTVAPGMKSVRLSVKESAVASREPVLSMVKVMSVLPPAITELLAKLLAKLIAFSEQTDEEGPCTVDLSQTDGEDFALFGLGFSDAPAKIDIDQIDEAFCESCAECGEHLPDQ